MAQKYDRVTTGTSRIREFLDGKRFKSSKGWEQNTNKYLLKTLKLDGRNKEGATLINIESRPSGNIIKIDYLPEVSKENIE